MNRGGQGTVFREIHRLFNSGTVSGLNEEELLARFVASKGGTEGDILIAERGD